MISTFVKNTPWRFERFALRTMLRVSSRLHLTLQLDASVSWKWRRVLVQRMTLLVPLEFPTSVWRSEQWRPILQPRQEEYRDFSSSGMLLLSCVSISPSCFDFF